MARQRKVTRTITMTVLEVVMVDLEVMEIVKTVRTVQEGIKTVADYNKKYENPRFQVVAVNVLQEVTNKYEMLEEEFLKYATISDSQEESEE